MRSSPNLSDQNKKNKVEQKEIMKEKSEIEGTKV
jgi:hypothetical protein